MKLLYTSIANHLTVLLTKEAQTYVEQGKRVFYIAPNSLSFEKERKVLETLETGASFDITVTRFGQLARYLLLNRVDDKKTLDDIGLSLLLYKVLTSIPEQDLTVYHRLKRDPNVMKQLLDLYKELQRSNLPISDLSLLEDTAKANDLIRIYKDLETLIHQGNFDNQSKLAVLSEAISSGDMDGQLADTVVVIDGFTRFSGEEKELVSLLNDKCSEVVIGVYASEKAYRSNMIYGNIYQASVDFLRDLAQHFETKPIYHTFEEQETAFSSLSKQFEAIHDFTGGGSLFTPVKAPMEIWEHPNQREEIDAISREIRHLLKGGARYKDILVLLGDVDSYYLQIKNSFEKFDIPYYFAKSESMGDHPLVTLIDSLERIKRYRYRGEDMVNLLKSGLFGNFTQRDSDEFEQYVRYADINGLAAFKRPFTANRLLKTKRDDEGGKTRTYRYNLEHLNDMRQQMIDSLEYLLSVKKQKGASLLDKFISFLTQIQLPQNLKNLTIEADQEVLEQYEQVWSTFTGILEQLHTIFADQVLTIDDFLALLKVGMLSSDYRTVPATVDVVQVKSYDLVEPHSAKHVFALGMGPEQFPKVVENKTLISDAERARLNELTGESSALDLIAVDNLKKNHFTAISLFNAAREKLVLTVPKLSKDKLEHLSPYLKELVGLGVPFYDKSQTYQADETAIGHYKDVLSQVIALNQRGMTRELNSEETVFWSVAVRYLRKMLAEHQVLIPTILDDLQVVPVSSEVMAIKFPESEPLQLSVSGLSAFYNNEYLYFVRYVLGLLESQSIKPDARIHGQYLHRVFERLLAEQPSSEQFDSTLETIIAKTKEEQQFISSYLPEHHENQLSLSILEDIARSTASFLRKSEGKQVQSQEEQFRLTIGNQVRLNGIIDRVDQLATGAYGVVDYKSSETKFQLQQFYNGLNSQLVTYLKALKEQYQLTSDQLFGAMYLHMQIPFVSLAEVKNKEQILTQNQSQLVYQGIFLEEEKAHLADGSYKLGANNLYTGDQIDTLLAYNDTLFTTAVDRIRSGNFRINPYTEDGKTVKGEQLRSITHFEADRHLVGHARRLEKLPKKGNTVDKLAAIEKMEGEIHAN